MPGPFPPSGRRRQAEAQPDSGPQIRVEVLAEEPPPVVGGHLGKGRPFVAAERHHGGRLRRGEPGQQRGRRGVFRQAFLALAQVW
jgi:hypothetical protein